MFRKGVMGAPMLCSIWNAMGLVDLRPWSTRDGLDDQVEDRTSYEVQDALYCPHWNENEPELVALYAEE